MNTHKVMAALVTVLVGSCMCGCAEKSTNGFRSPTMTASFQTIPADEQRPLTDGMAKTDAKKIGALEYAYTFPAKDIYTPEEIATALKNWHQEITKITNDRGTPIAAHDKIEIRLVYISSKAESGSTARVYIEPYPEGAKLFLDTKVPSAAQESDGSVKLNSNGKFEAALPFSFIRSTNRIYFHTVYRSSERYFYYDIDRQQQEEVPAKNADEWSEFMKSGSLPSR